MTQMRRRSLGLRPLPVLCGLGKSRLISGVYPEQFELSPSNNDGLKTRRNPESTKYRYSGIQKD